MSSFWLRAATRVANGWVGIYTGGMHPEIAERRRAEVESDVWETVSQEDGKESGLAWLVVFDRLVRGLPSDLMWSFEARRVAPRSGEGVSATSSIGHPGPLSPVGRLVFQAIAAVAIAGAAVEVVGQFLRVTEFRAAVPVEEPFGVAVLVAIYCVPPLTALIACAVAVPLVIRAERLPEARTLALFLAFMALFWASVFSFFYFLPSSEPGRINFGMAFGPGASAWAYTWYVLAVVAFLRFSALFPRPLKLAGAGRSGLPDLVRGLQTLSTLPVIVWSMGGTLILIMAAPAVGRTWTPASSTPEISWNLFWILAVSRMILGYLILPMGMMGLGVLNLYRGLRTATERDRARSLWVFAGFFSAFWMITIGSTLNFLGDLPDPVTVWQVPLVLFAPLVIVVCLTVAVFYRGDLDPALVIRRSTVYGALGVLFVGLFAVAENLVSDSLVNRMGVPDTVGGALLAVFVALIVIPLRRRLTALVTRLGPRSASRLERVG